MESHFYAVPELCVMIFNIRFVDNCDIDDIMIMILHNTLS